MFPSYVGFVVALLPASRAKNFLMSRIPGWQVDAQARVEPCFIYRVRTLNLSAAARIGLGTGLRNLRRAELGRGAGIGRRNSISANAALVRDSSADSSGVLRLRAESAITARHRIDCTGGVDLGSLSVIAGRNSVVLTHGIDFAESFQTSAPVVIGDACFLGTNCVVTAGVTVAHYIVVGAGSVISRSLDESESLYAGAPASKKKSLAGARFFQRQSGYVGPRPSEV